MSFPVLKDILSQLSWVPLELPVVILFISGSVLILIKDWRASIGALLAQYVTMGFILAHLVRPEIAFAKVMVGLLICLMLYLSARQASWRQRLTFSGHGLRALLGARFVGGEVFPPGRAFRLMALLLIGVTTFSLAQSYPISSVPAPVTLAVYWLVLAGGLPLILTENPLKVGQGLLTIIIGFELWFTTLEPNLLLAGLWGTVNLLLALAVGYLAAVRGVQLEEEF